MCEAIIGSKIKMAIKLKDLATRKYKMKKKAFEFIEMFSERSSERRQVDRKALACLLFALKAMRLINNCATSFMIV